MRKSFVTFRAMRYKNWNVHFRDTILLSPSGQSLKMIGKLYPELPKIEIGKDDLTDMKIFFELKPDLFERYSVRDSVLCLWHSLQVELSQVKFNSSYGIPLTLSSLASSYLRGRLIENNAGDYHGPQPNKLYSVKDLSRVITPTGIELSGGLHEYIDYFLGSYHGGRNESYLYGIIEKKLFDYDLPGAYPTAMSLLEYPSWKDREVVTPMDLRTFLGKYSHRLIRSYTALKVRFKFSEKVRYPCLPVRVDKTSIIFPLEGESFCTGLELSLAIRLGCEIEIIGGSVIPFSSQIIEHGSPINQGESVETEMKKLFKRDSFLRKPEQSSELKRLQQLIMNRLEKIKSGKEFNKEQECEIGLKAETVVSFNESEDESYSVLEKEGSYFKKSAFHTVIKELTMRRKEYPKGSYENQLYKFLANSGIGQMARGLNQKKVFDASTRSAKKVESGVLVNPLYGGWITSFIRCVLAEIMNGIEDDKIIVSCTTDGFITDKEDLPQILKNRVLNSKDLSDSSDFIAFYFKARESLGVGGEVLEMKFIEPKGLISWTTRGQLGLSGGIRAMTGYQNNQMVSELVEDVKRVFDDDKQVPFIQSSLRSAKDIILEGGHVCLKLEERIFNLKYDNRRLIKGYKDGFYSSIPHVNVNSCRLARSISSLSSNRYNKYYPLNLVKSDGRTYLSLTKRMLVRVLLNSSSFLKTDRSFERSEIVEIMGALGVKCLKDYVSKQRHAYPIPKSLPATDEIRSILKRFKDLFPSFDINYLLR